MYVSTQRAAIDWRTFSMLVPLTLLALFSQFAMAGVRVEAPAASFAGRGASDTEATFDVDQVVEQVSHAVTAVAGQPGAFAVPGAGYDATFDPAGVRVDGLRIAVSDVARAGATSLDVAPGAWTPDANVAQRALAAGVAERVTAGTVGVEWDVVLTAPPAGTGDLTVTASLGGLDPTAVPQRRDAAWLLTVAGGAQVTIDELVVLDAAGTELYRALPDIAGSVLQLTVPSSVLDGAAYPLTLDPTVSPERLVSSRGTSQDDEDMAIAFDGTNFLVVWRTLNTGIFGTRVTPGGAAIDIPAIQIAISSVSQRPAVAFDGSNFLVVWTSDSGIAGRIVSPAGAVGSTIEITAAAGTQDQPDVAFNGNSYVVAWEDNRSGAYDIYAARVTTAGTVLDASGLVVSNATGAQNAPAVAYDGTNTLVVWSDARAGSDDIFGARVGPGGGVSDPAGIPISTAAGSQRQPEVAFDGTNHLVVWSDNRSGTYDIYGARVSPAGSVLNPSGIAVSTAAVDQSTPTVAYDGASYLVAWADTREHPSFGYDVFASRVTTAGTVVTPAGTPVSTTSGGAGLFSLGPAVASGGGTFFLAWEDTRSLDDAYASRISSAGAVLDPKGLRLSSRLPEPGQSEAVVAFDGTNYLVAWSAYNGTLDIWGARVAPGGRVLDPDGFAISTAAGDQLQPAVAYGGGQFLVTWTERGTAGIDDIFMTKVSSAGVVANPNGLPVSTGAPYAYNSAVAWNGSRFLVVWTDSRGGPITTTIYAARVNAGGLQDPTGIQLSPTDGFETEPTVASNGSDFLVAWGDSRDFAGGTQIYANRVSDAGTVIAPGEFVVASRIGSQSLPAAAFDGTNYFVAYVQGNPSGERDLYGTRVSPAGAVLDGTTTGQAISTAAGDQTLPQIAFNGSYLVVWTQRNGATEDEFYGARVATNGVVTDTTPFLIANGGTSTGTFPVRAAAVTKGPGGDWGFIYDRGYAGIYLRAVAPK